MDVKYYKEIIKILDLKFADKKLKIFYLKFQKTSLKTKETFLNFGKPVFSK